MNKLTVVYLMNFLQINEYHLLKTAIHNSLAIEHLNDTN